MTYPILPDPPRNRSVLSRTRDFLTSMRQDESTPIQINIYKKTTELFGFPFFKIETFSAFHVLSIAFNDEEVSETVVSSEGCKIRVGDRLFRTVTLAGFILDGAPAGSSRVRHAGHKSWSEFYDKARFSQIAGTDKIVQIIFNDITFFGAFISSRVGLSSDNPGRIDVTCSFICRDIKLNRNVVGDIEGTDIKGKMTYEGLAHVGVIGPIAYDPTNVMIDLVNTNPDPKPAEFVYRVIKPDVASVVSLNFPPPPVFPSFVLARRKVTVKDFKIIPT